MKNEGKGNKDNKEFESLILELLQWIQILQTRDIISLNRLETILINEIIKKNVVILKKKKNSHSQATWIMWLAHELSLADYSGSIHKY